MSREPVPVPSLRPLALALAASVCAAAPVAAQQGADGPELRLFSSTIVEDIRRTGEAAADMEVDVQGSIESMDRQLGLYRASACESAGEDPGCGEMRRQLGQSYGAMLDAMEEALPQMEDAITRSRDGLQSSLVRQLGRGSTSSEIMTLLLDDGGQSAVAARPARTGGGARLSERFRQYHTLVAGTSGGARRGRGALAVTAADIYLDMDEASDLISLTRDEIARAQIYANIDEIIPGLTVQMEETVDGVKRILFGESEVASAPDLAPPSGSGENVAPGDFTSDLEL